MLSSQTKDTVTSAAVKTLQTSLPGGLTLNSIIQVDEKVLDTYIKSVGFHNRKAKYDIVYVRENEKVTEYLTASFLSPICSSLKIH